MLLWMKLKNLALVEEAEIEFAPDFNVISGETGAGKSVIMGGLAMLLGARADKASIRTGTDRCEISAEFHLPDYAKKRIVSILDEAGVDPEEAANSLLIRRVVTPVSTRNYVNSVPVALPVLRQLGELLIDIHAANENQSLLKPSEQLRTLDRFAVPEKWLTDTANAWDELKAAEEEQDQFLETMPSAAEAEAMRHDAAIIEKANPEPGEDDELSRRHAAAANSRSIIEITAQVSGGLTEGDGSLFDRTADLRRVLSELERYEPDTAETFLSRLETISDNIRELSSDLVDHASCVE